MLLISLDSLWIRLSEAGSWEVAFWLGTFIALSMSVLVRLVTGRSPVSILRRDGLPLLVSGALQSGSGIFFVLALGLTTVANVVVIIATAPILAGVVARLTIGESAPRRVWLATPVSIAGIALVVGGSLGAGRIEGDLLAVAAISCFAFNVTLWRRYPDLNRMMAVGLGGLGMALVSLVAASPSSVDGRALGILAVAGVLTGPAGRVALASSTRFLGAAQASLFTPIETVAATTWAWLFLGEPAPATTIAGGAIVLAAVVYGTSRPRVSPSPG